MVPSTSGETDSEPAEVTLHVSLIDPTEDEREERETEVGGFVISVDDQRSVSGEGKIYLIRAVNDGAHSKAAALEQFLAINRPTWACIPTFTQIPCFVLPTIRIFSSMYHVNVYWKTAARLSEDVNSSCLARCATPDPFRTEVESNTSKICGEATTIVKIAKTVGKEMTITSISC